MTDELESLIQEAAQESIHDDDVNSVDNEGDSFFNYPAPVSVSWVLCLFTAITFYIYPLPANDQRVSRSVTTQLGVAMYHVAHRVESYRQMTGGLPDYLDPDWQESTAVTYRLTSEGYVLEGRLGELKLTYRQGENAEKLIFPLRKEGDR